jgi:hypothetical protein
MQNLSRFPTFLFALGSSALLAFASTVRADDNEQGGDISGTESMEVEVAMIPTAAAPAGSSIELSLENEDDDGMSTATLKLETKMLPADTYSVSVTLKSDGSTVALGGFTSDGSEAEVEFGSSEGTPFPPNFNPFDIATVTVFNSINVAIFTADLTSLASVASISMSAAITATPGPAAPNANGTAALLANAVRGAASGSLVLTGHSLPAKTKVNVVINGTTVKKTSTDSAGNANVSLVPKAKGGTIGRGVTIFGVRSVRLTNGSGAVLLDASF